jgi:hypothetical protein
VQHSTALAVVAAPGKNIVFFFEDLHLSKDLKTTTNKMEWYIVTKTGEATLTDIPKKSPFSVTVTHTSPSLSIFGIWT